MKLLRDISLRTKQLIARPLSCWSVDRSRTASRDLTHSLGLSSPLPLQVDDNGDYQTANADDFYGEKHGLDHWIVSKSVPTVGL
jgi:hypothetical protein